MGPPAPGEALPPVPSAPQQPQVYRFGAFRVDGSALYSEVTADNIEVSLRLSWQAGSGFTLFIRARPLQPTWVRLLGLELDIDADSAVLLGRDLRPLNLEGSAVLGRLDPKWVTLYRRGRPLLTVVGGDDIDGLQVRRMAGRVRLRVDLIAVEARPFF